MLSVVDTTLSTQLCMWVNLYSCWESSGKDKKDFLFRWKCKAGGMFVDMVVLEANSGMVTQPEWPWEILASAWEQAKPYFSVIHGCLCAVPFSVSIWEACWFECPASLLQEGDNDAGVVAILDKGRVHTSERMDVACIHARDHSTGRSEIATCIRVAEAWSLTILLEFNSMLGSSSNACGLVCPKQCHFHGLDSNRSQHIWLCFFVMLKMAQVVEFLQVTQIFKKHMLACCIVGLQVTILLG